MNQNLVFAINRLAEAHEKLAGNVGRIADALRFEEGRVSDLSAVEILAFELGQLSSSVDGLKPESSEGG